MPQGFEAPGTGDNALRGDLAGSGPAVVQAHGITATRKYVTHGSRLLERRGYRAIRYDARGHGESDPAPGGQGYDYERLADDLGAVVDSVSSEKPVVLAGHSMGAHTATAYALRRPERVAALVAIGPASLGEPPREESVAYWDGLAVGLERGGVEGFMDAYDDGSHDPDWREVVLRLARQRLGLHSHPDALAQALRDVPRSLPFEGASSLEGLSVPTLVVASHDTADPGHPFVVAEEWSSRIPQARLVSEDEGESPLAWQGGRLSREIAGFCQEPAVAERLGSPG